MERESFENEDIAKLLNEDFVCIKVDREERPDVDRIYVSESLEIHYCCGWRWFQNIKMHVFCVVQ